MIRRILLVAGVAALLFGLLFLGQGLGIVRWPASSFMIADHEWVWRGAVIALIGAVLVWRNRR